jgi:class 3 adenylate cyclase/tetratricopeptide (TPR) repeat protein
MIVRQQRFASHSRTMSFERSRLQAGITALEAQRQVLGDDVVDVAIAGLRAGIAAIAEVPDSAAGSRQLRQVTILFLDVVESTALSRHIDVEATSEVMDGLLARSTSIVEAHGGKVLQYAGDSLLAVFGATEAREDDAERGVQSGLALLELGRDVATEVESAHAWKGFAVRVGMHTGAVLLGGGVDADDSIRGSAVSIAARMEQTAPAGALRISDDTYGLVRGIFDVVLQAPLAIKGVEAPVASYLVERAKPRAFRVPSRGIEGVATRMVGRGPELGRLMAAFDRVVRSGAGFASVLVIAEPGIGKSRLLYEMQNQAEARTERFVLFQARAVPSTQGQPYGLLRELFAWRLQIADDDPMDVAKHKLESGLLQLLEHVPDTDDAHVHVHLLGQIFGLDYADSPSVRGIGDDPKQFRCRGLQAAAWALRAWAANWQAPLVICVDDLHWADDASLSFFRYLSRVNVEVPTLLVVLARPMLFERWPEAYDESGAANPLGGERIDLAPLAARHSDALVDEILQRLPSVPPGLRALLTGRAQGNPYFMEELVRILIERGAIRTSSNAWSVDADRFLDVTVPPTLTGVLQARIDALAPAERHALQLASVIGPRFWDAALEHVESGTSSQLPSLVRRELIERRPGGDAGNDAHEYVFRHHLLQQVAYNTVLKRVKRPAHAKVAQWLSERRGAAAGPLAGSAAEHYEAAGDTVRAAQSHAIAAEHAASIFAHDAALAHAGRALVLAEGDAFELRWRVCAARERLLDRLGRRAEQRGDLAVLEMTADAMNDDRRRAEAAWRRSDIAMRTGDWIAQEHEARRARDLALRCGAEDLELKSLQRLSTAIALRGDPKAGRTMAEAGLRRARSSGSLDLQSRLANSALCCAELDGDRVASLTYARMGVSISRASGNRRSETISLGNLGNTYTKLGLLPEARIHLADAVDIARSLGERAIEGNMLGALSEVMLALGDIGAAAEAAAMAVAIAREVGSRFHLVDALWNLGNSKLALAELVAAQTAFAEAESLARQVGPRTHMLLHAIDGQARVALANGEVNVATEHVATLLCEAGVIEGGPIDDVLRSEAFADAEWYQLGLTIYRVWSACADPRAAAGLALAYSALETAANSISDEGMRRRFVDEVVTHREVAAAWGAYRAGR